MQDKLGVLKSVFGYAHFRPGQEEIIEALLHKQDAVGIMPTGSGKSLCFQIPALLSEGVSLVISPLISLMKDQVNALIQAGIPAAYINSSLSAGQIQKVLLRARSGVYKIIYVAPERLTTEGFMQLAGHIHIPFVAVDEAHCVSQWGQDFRPSYLKIRDFIKLLPDRPVMGAFTATATPPVREDIVRLLGLEEPVVVATGFDRENLYFEVRHPKNKFAALETFLAPRKKKSGIIYCLTRKTVEEVCERLQRLGYPATRYHAGLSDEERKKNQESFQTDQSSLMVATNAFGMGIDKSNVSFVLHFNMPKNMESYYQEAGRAGRDGLPAECVLFYSGQDVITNQFLIEKTKENEELEVALQERHKYMELERLRQMTFYCHTRDCLRHFILRYFGESAPTFCGNCFNCAHHFETMDITVAAQKILSCVKRMGERFGIKMLCDTLRGSRSDKVLRLGFDRLSTYGIMKDTGENRLREIINHLILLGYLTLSEGPYPVLSLTRRSREVLFEGQTLTMNVLIEAAEPTKEEPHLVAGPFNQHLFDQLKKLRGELAQQQSVPAYVIFPDAALRDMCVKMPRSEKDMLQVNGVGEVKLRRYGAAFLEIIRQAQ